MKTHRVIVLAVCILIALVAGSHAGIQVLHPTGEKLPDGTSVAVVADSTDKSQIGTKTNLNLSGYQTTDTVQVKNLPREKVNPFMVFLPIIAIIALVSFIYRLNHSQR